MKFFIRSINDPNTVIQLQGRIIEIKPFGKFYVDHRHVDADPSKPFCGYAITEPRTGSFVAMAHSVKEAWYSAFDSIDNRNGWNTAEKFKQKIDERVSRYGQVNEAPL